MYITRRYFLQQSLSIAAVGCISGTVMDMTSGPDTKDTRCQKCGALISIVAAELTICPNCGWHFTTRTIVPSCACCPNRRADAPRGLDYPNCSQIPFPNHKYIRNSTKPNFSIKGLRF